MFSKVPAGKNPPDDIYVIIENPMGGTPVKYEIDKETDTLFVDRFTHTPMFYPANYGYIPQTLGGDGDPVDVLAICHVPVMPGAVLRVRPIGVLMMEDDGGVDEKIVAVPHDKMYPAWSNITEYTQLPKIQIDQITHFFTHYKDLEPGKWAKITGWGDAATAKKLIVEGLARAKEDTKAA